MANGTINLTSSDNTFEGRVSWSSTLDKTNKKSTLTLTYQVRRVNISNTSGGNGSTYTISGKLNLLEGVSLSAPNISYSTPTSINVPNTGTWVNLYTSTHTIYHSQFSGRATVEIDCSIYGGINKVSFEVADARMTMERIIETPTLLTAPNFTDEDNPTITYSNPMGSSITSLQAAIANPNGNVTYIAYRNIDMNGSSYTFNFTSSERSQLRALLAESYSVQVRFYIKAVIDGVTYHSYSAVRTLSVVDGAPTLAPTVKDTDETTTVLTGNNQIIVRGHNKLSYAFNAKPAKGASIVSYSVVCAEFSGNTSTGTFENVGSNEFVFTIVDSRGAVATETIVLEMIDYIEITCNQKVSMALEPSGSNTKVNLHVSGNYFSGNFGAYDNEIAVWVRHTQNDGTMGEWTEITPLLSSITGGTYELDTEITGFDPSGSYVFQCAAADYLGEVFTEEYTITFKPVFDWSRTDFNFNVPISIEGYPLADYVIETGTASMGSNGTWYWRKWKSGRADCYGCRNYGNMAIGTAWGGLYRSQAFAQDLPAGLFIDTPEVIDITYRGSNYGGWIAKHEDYEASSSSSGGFIIVRPASTTLTQAHIGFNVIGRWQ